MLWGVHWQHGQPKLSPMMGWNLGCCSSSRWEEIHKVRSMTSRKLPQVKSHGMHWTTPNTYQHDESRNKQWWCAKRISWATANELDTVTIGLKSVHCSLRSQCVLRTDDVILQLWNIEVREARLWAIANELDMVTMGLKLVHCSLRSPCVLRTDYVILQL